MWNAFQSKQKICPEKLAALSQRSGKLFNWCKGGDSRYDGEKNGSNEQRGNWEWLTFEK
ncbi:hypothetical protein BPA01_16370 [Brevibacillus parabrevis]|uniref:Uncharacterized protein n=1 Tax=Brevibacillus parabrevis TaxID=54914 RepID=A0A4Y3PFE6_BREPA|nr:hypothetical protein BPA01_16370 [Brevibacillus parabrevis]